MTEKQLIFTILICLLVEWWTMRRFWLRCEAAEKEVKRLKEKIEDLVEQMEG